MLSGQRSRTSQTHFTPNCFASWPRHQRQRVDGGGKITSGLPCCAAYSFAAFFTLR